MARVVRKVSNKNIANANKNKKVNKWLIGGIIAGVVVAIAVAVILWVTLGGNDEEVKFDYFDTYEIVEGDKTTEVEFTKTNYASLANLMNENYEGYIDGIIIVLAYNSDNFDPENEDDVATAEQHAKLLAYVANLQVLVNEAKEADCEIELFIVDISISENEWGIMNDAVFGGKTNVTAENVGYVEPLLAVIDNNADEKLVEKCSQTTLSKILSTGIPKTENLINDLLN